MMILCGCVFIKVHMTAHSGPVLIVIGSINACVCIHYMLLYVTHPGVTFRDHIFWWTCACIQP